MTVQPCFRLAVSLGGAAFVAATILSACGSAKPSTSPSTPVGVPVLHVAMSNSGTKINGNLDLHPGPVTFDVTSRAGDHQFQLFKLAPGYSLANYLADGQAAFGAHPDPAATQRYLANVTDLGGVEIFPGARSASFTQTLTDGTYYAGELPEDQRHMPTIHVSGSTNPAKAPPTSATITALDSGWNKSTNTIPDQGSIKVHNAGLQSHFLLLFPVESGTTRGELGAYLRKTGAAADAPPPPFAKNGPQLGTATLSPGIQMTFTYDLPAGEYAIISFFPDMNKGGEPQALEGLYDLITLS